MKPLQVAAKSKAKALTAPRLVCTKQAVEGKTISGVIVATIITSISFGLRFASARAFFAASVAKRPWFHCPSVMCLVFMPVRVVIHSSVVSTIFVRSSLVRIFFGANEPEPAMTARNAGLMLFNFPVLAHY